MAEKESAPLDRAQTTAEVYLELEQWLGRVLSSKHCKHAVAEWGENAIRYIEDNPYVLMDLPRSGFKTADRVAEELGLSPSDDRRIRASVIYALRESANLNQHTRITVGKNKYEAGRILSDRGSVSRQQIVQAVDWLRQHGEIVTKQSLGAVYNYLPGYYEQEKYVAAKLLELNGATPRTDTLAIRSCCEGLAADQGQALTMLHDNNVFILTGAPGMGKTFLIKRILETFPNELIVLAAPTGKAAKRMMEQTGGYEAKTIHRLLEARGSPEGGFVFMRDEEKPLQASFVILDEVSMVDISLMFHLLKALKPGTRLVMVGDSYQLPSVGPGSVLRDLILSNCIPCMELVQPKRQKIGLLLKNIYRIKDRLHVRLDPDDTSFRIVHRCESESIQAAIAQLMAHDLPEEFDIAPSDIANDIQVITPYKNPRKGLATIDINPILQQKLNPQGRPWRKLRIGDKVIQTRNRYDLHDDDGNAVLVVNGDLGRVLDIIEWETLRDRNTGRQVSREDAFKEDGQLRDNVEEVMEGGVMVRFEDPDRDVPMVGADAYELELAYALTCHKFQGSEARIVIIPANRNFGKFVNRKWIYTAVSRAKECCIIVGEQFAINRFIDTEEFRRETGLAEAVVEQGPNR